MLRALSHGWWRHLLVVLGCVHLLGGPAVIVQGAAWASMLVTYSAKDGIAQGVTDTFSGEKPCCLCMKARELEHQQSELPATPNRDDRRLSSSETLAATDHPWLSDPRSKHFSPSALPVHPDDAPPSPALKPETPPPRATA